MVSMIDLDSLTHVAWHAVGWDASGNITNTSSWEAVAPSLVASAHAVGTRVHLNLMPLHSTHVSVLSNATNRSNAVEQLAALVHEYGADGISIDIESMPSSMKEELVLFTAEMRAAVDEVIVATPLIDWGYAYDYDELAAASDGLFIMGYDAHGPHEDSGAGPISMMETGGGMWPHWTLPYSLNDEYRMYGAPDDKIIMGLPLYGALWETPSEEYPASAMVSDFSDYWPMNDLLDAAPVYGRRFDEPSVSAWMWDASTGRQIWYDDPETLEVKMSWALGEGIQGIGFWEVSYATGEPDFWDIVDDLTMTEVVEEDTGSTEDTGPPEDTGTPGDDDGFFDGIGDDDGSGDDDDGTDAGGTTGTFGDPDDGGREDTGFDDPKNKGCSCATARTSPSTLWLVGGILGFLSRRRRSA
jgi:MYXO-CTERM domain-containing protein